MRGLGPGAQPRPQSHSVFLCLSFSCYLFVSPSPLRSPNIDNFIEQHFETQNSTRNTRLTTSTGSTEQHLLENGNVDLRGTGITSLVQHTLSFPPAYDDVLQQDPTTITMEEQSLLPPSYDDFMREKPPNE